MDPARFIGPRGTWTSAGAPRPWDEDPVDGPLRAEVRDVLERALHRLPERQASLVVLRDGEGRSAAEVCDLLALTPANQRLLLHRGRAAVRAALERYQAGLPAD